MTFPCIITTSAAAGGKTYDPNSAEGEIIHWNNSLRCGGCFGGSGRRGAGVGGLAPCQAWQGSTADGWSSLCPFPAYTRFYLTPRLFTGLFSCSYNVFLQWGCSPRTVLIPGFHGSTSKLVGSDLKPWWKVPVGFAGAAIPSSALAPCPCTALDAAPCWAPGNPLT